MFRRVMRPVFLRPGDPFPDPHTADHQGLLAVGGDLQGSTLIDAYTQGIFPWYSEGQPLLWFCPDPRFVLPINEFHVGRSLRKTLRKRRFEIRLDTAFEQVIRACAVAPRPGQDGTWITEDMIRAYCRLHAVGLAHSAEAWLDGELVGGVYGLGLGKLFAGESMFAKVPDASKVAFVWLVRHLEAQGYELIDCQMKTPHLARFNARDIPRRDFLGRLPELTRGTSMGLPWRFEEGFQPLDIEPRT